MNNILITDLQNYKYIDSEKYTKVNVLLYADFKGSIEE